MKRLCISLILVAVIFHARGQAPMAVDPKEEENVKSVLNAFINAWNTHDAKAFANVFSEDADFVNVAGKSKHGRAEIEKHHEPGFKTKWKESNQKITQQTIRFIKPDVAAVDAWWELTGIKGADGQNMPARRGLLNFIMTKNEGKWLITVMHNTEIKDQP